MLQKAQEAKMAEGEEQLEALVAAARTNAPFQLKNSINEMMGAAVK